MGGSSEGHDTVGARRFDASQPRSRGCTERRGRPTLGVIEMDALLIIDMQNGMLEGEPKHALDEVVSRINALANHIRLADGRVIFVRHEGPAGSLHEPGSFGWEFLPELRRVPEDRVVAKNSNDAFNATSLQAELDAMSPDRVFVSGWAADLCVDSTIRSAVRLDYRVIPVADAITVSDRPTLTAPQVIQHHLWLWSELISRHPVRARVADAIINPTREAQRTTRTDEDDSEATRRTRERER